MCQEMVKKTRTVAMGNGLVDCVTRQKENLFFPPFANTKFLVQSDIEYGNTCHASNDGKPYFAEQISMFT